MTTMTSSNPYVAPRAAVRDASEEIQPVRVFGASGRIGRARYICYSTLLPMAILFIAGLAGAALGPLGMVLMMVGYVLAVILIITLTIQRSHDFDMSGWMALLLVVPVANLLFWIVPGTDGANRFGGKTPPNGIGVLIGAWLMPALVVLGTVAAVALPAHQDDAKRPGYSRTR